MALALILAAAMGTGIIGGNRIDLSGTWAFKLDPHDRGVTERWSTEPLPGRIHLPGTTDEAGYGPKTTKPEVGVLTRVVKYYGPAWYRRTIEIPKEWAGMSVDLTLERVIWSSQVWIDGKPEGLLDSLNTPHIHTLGKLSPGFHALAVRIDNRPQYPIGANGHSYTEQTQTVWNGIVGRIELRAHPASHVELVRVFPSTDRRSALVEVNTWNDSSKFERASVEITLRAQGSDRVVAKATIEQPDPPGPGTLRGTIHLESPANPWDEFKANLYRIDVRVATARWTDQSSATFGFRTVSRIGQHIAVNGRPVFLRGNLDCVHFPLTGYPAMNVEGWKRIFRIYKAHGLNHVRFHTWTPPEAAFEAADELGIYIQSEVVWVQRRLGKDTPGPMENMNSAFPDSLLDVPGTVDPYVHSEIRRISDAYGNHPSFLLFTIGNELGSYDPDACGQWIDEIKRYDPRRFYAVSTARQIVPQDDYNVTHAIPNVGWCRDRVDPLNDWDYEAVYSKAPVPIIAHEVGQWPAYPTWDEIGKYRGVLRARNYEEFRKSAIANGVVNLDKAFRSASGALSMRLYKDEIESHLRTPSCSGFDLLSMQDFSGQGEALVGWLDSFYDSKGIVEPSRFRRWCDSTVPLARLPKYVYSGGEEVRAAFEIAHYGPTPLPAATVAWSLRKSDGALLGEGTCAPANLPASTVRTAGSMSVRLGPCSHAYRARLEAKLLGTPYANDWDIWVFPDPVPAPTDQIVVCDDLETAASMLKHGKKVLLDAHRMGSRENAKYARFKPVYWSASMFGGQYTLGALVRNDSPALSGFPTDNHFDWQWEELCRNARGFRLDGFPLDYQPIVQPICDFHFNWKLGSIFELKPAFGGSLLVCGYDVTDDLAHRPAARTLRASLLAYMASSRFAPRTPVTQKQLVRMMPTLNPAPVSNAPNMSQALVHVIAGGNHPSSGDVPWSTAVDRVQTTSPGFGYSVQCNAVWKDEVGTAWFGSPRLRIDVKAPKPGSFVLFVHFHDWNDEGRSGRLLFGGKEYELGPHAGAGVWVRFPVRPEDCPNGQISLIAEPTSGPNLMVTQIALLPYGK
ncbi:MAG: glycoside hydrolase family 2 TIM barrel-domain containing protein [Fimbriimonas sp.]|nr:glycoside hydrolase family 2 TIM barrel-domain containing protein [Fimbriimonas sp.]